MNRREEEEAEMDGDDGGVEELLGRASATLEEAMKGRLAMYRDLLEHKGPGFVDGFFDLVVLTACDEDQAQSYRTVLEHRQSSNAIPNTRWACLSVCLSVCVPVFVPVCVGGCVGAFVHQASCHCFGAGEDPAFTLCLFFCFCFFWGGGNSGYCHHSLEQ